MFNILIVEDDPKLLTLFSTVLERHHYLVHKATNGEEALEVLDQQYIDLVISDLMMPHMDGFELSRLTRNAYPDLPILIITAKEQFQDIRAAFKTGIDDYMVKPINVNEMVLRVEALLRRSKSVHAHKLSFGGLTLHYEDLEVVTSLGHMILPQKEFQILYKLASSPNRTFTRQQLFDEIWGLESDTDIRTIDVHINRLRERFSQIETIKITTVRGLGYKIEEIN